MLTEVGEQCHLQPLGKVGGGVIKLQQSGELQLGSCSLQACTEAQGQGGHQGPQGLNQQYRHHLMGVLENLRGREACVSVHRSQLSPDGSKAALGLLKTGL